MRIAAVGKTSKAWMLETRVRHGVPVPIRKHGSTGEESRSKVQQKKIHPLKRAKFRDQAQRPSVVKSRPC